MSDTADPTSGSTSDPTSGSTSGPTPGGARARANRVSDRTIMLACVVFFSSMIGVAYASVPLYRWFCQVTGFGGTTQVAEAAPVEVLDRTIKVRFDANVAGGLPWAFRPLQREVEVRIGEVSEVAYYSENLGGRDTVGSATFNVTPQAAGIYFNKMHCFCFEEQTLKEGEGTDMPIVFYVDPGIVEAAETQGLDTITLSYTFFPVDAPDEVAAVDAR